MAIDRALATARSIQKLSGLSTAGYTLVLERGSKEKISFGVSEYVTPACSGHANPGSAVLVARTGADQLYATTNSEGSYCLVVSTPWKQPQTDDGGTCVSNQIAESPIVRRVPRGHARCPSLCRESVR
jgi:hypothetical protein